MGDTIDFMGSGKDIVELMKKALCDFKDVRIDEAVLTSPNKFIDEGTAVISLLIDIPEEKKWVSIYYTHMEEGVGYGSITYQEHTYQERAFPQNWIEKSAGIFQWGDRVLTEQQILDEIFERSKCHKYYSQKYGKKDLCDIVTPEFITNLSSAIWYAEDNGWSEREHVEKLQYKIDEIGKLCGIPKRII